MKSIKKKEKKGKVKMNKGGRNLVILGIVSTLVAISTTGVSLAIYHNSGDIYLDRSRPGFLPDEEEIEDEENQDEEDYDFSKSGKIDLKVIDEYLEELDDEVRAIDSYEKPFDLDVLSDERLGITEMKEEK